MTINTARKTQRGFGSRMKHEFNRIHRIKTSLKRNLRLEKIKSFCKLDIDDKSREHLLEQKYGASIWRHSWRRAPLCNKMRLWSKRFSGQFSSFQELKIRYYGVLFTIWKVVVTGNLILFTRVLNLQFVKFFLTYYTNSIRHRYYLSILSGICQTDEW